MPRPHSKNEVVTRERSPWTFGKRGDRGDDADIDVYINALRKKVDRIGPTALIQTVRGVGYVLREGS
jgi:DNA-binding response OmpR family regulator